MTEDRTKLTAALEKKRAERAAVEAAAAERKQETPVGLEDYVASDRVWDPDPFIAHVKGMSARAAVEQLTNKDKKPTRYNQKDGIKFRCPHSDHEDYNPSAWLNQETHTWYCGSCEAGGDWFELAAAMVGYRTSRGWNDRTRDWPLLVDFLKGLLSWTEPEKQPYEPSPEVIQAIQAIPEPIREASFTVSGTATCQFDWASIVPEKTFLREYMDRVTVDDCPEEFHFAAGLLALGLAIGREVALSDQPAVLGNLYVCVIGDSGTGKSKSGRYLKNLLHDALPFRPDDMSNKGVSLVSSPASGEVLYKEFSRPIPDPSDERRIAFYASVRGLIDYPELSGLSSRAGRQGSTVKASLIELYDSPKVFANVSLTRGRMYAEDPFGCLLTSTQPSSMAKLVSSDDDKSGFLNRIAFFTGTPKTPFAVNTAHVEMTFATAMLKLIHEWASDFTAGKYVTWEPDALSAWTDFFMDEILPMKRSADNDMLGRIDLLMKKLILLFTANEMQETVTPRAVEQARALFPYLTKVYSFTLEQVERDTRTELEDKVLIMIHKMLQPKLNGGKVPQEDWVTARELQQRVRPRMDSEGMHRLLTSLVRTGNLDIYEPPKSGRGRFATRYAPIQYS